MEWCKFYAEWGTDPKVQSMSEPMRCRHAMLLSLRCSHEVSKLSNDELLFYFRLTQDQLEETKMLFMSKGFIDKKWNVLKWDKRQSYASSAAMRMRTVRERKRNMLRNECEPNANAIRERNAQLAHAEEEQNREEKKEKNPPAPKGEIVFVLPDCIPKPDWDAYIDMRRTARKKLTIPAMRLLANKLTEAHRKGHDLAKMLQAATIGNWSSVYEPEDRPLFNGKHEPKKEEPLVYVTAPPDFRRKPEPKP